jgi:hypothetical protein
MPSNTGRRALEPASAIESQYTVGIEKATAE